MADINFGILDTQMPGRIAAIPQQQQAQQAQNAMQLMQVQQTMQQNALAKAKMEEYTRGTAEKNALRGRMTQPGFNIYDPAHQAEIMSLSPELAPGIIKHALDVETAKSTNAKNVAQTGVAQAGITKAKRDFGNEARRSLSFNPSDANIQAWNEDAVKRGFITQQEADLEVQDMLRVPLDQRKTVFERAGAPAVAPVTPTELSKYVSERAAMLPGDPRIANWDAKIAELSTAPAAQRDITNRQGADRIKQGWGQLNVAQRNAATNEARLELQKNAPKLGLIDSEDIDRVAFAVASGKIPVDRLNSTTAPLFAKLLKAQPDLDLTNLSIEQLGARTGFVTSARIDARQKLTDVDATQAENIAKGNLPPATGPNAGKIMNAVIAINPEYNSRDFGLQTAAEKEFNIGKNGNKTRSLNVAVSHLGTLDTAAAALHSGDIRVFNQFKQAWQRETGKTAPTDFNAVRELVADEIVAAVVPGVGALADRKALKDTIMAKSSPAQLQGVIKQYKELLGGQLGGLEQQYNAATGKTNFKQRYLTPEARAALAPGQTAPPAGAASTATNTNPYAAKTDAEILRALEGK